MKKHLLWRGAIFAACAVILFFGSCSQTEFDGRIDTVYTLDTPSVTAKAYPGVNIVSWNPVTGAGGYKISVYEEGFCIKSDVDAYDNYYIDSNLLNGKKYTYYVEAVSVTNPGTFAEKGVYAKNSRGEATATAIVPPADTKSLELPAYEDGYDGTNTKRVSENDQWIVNDTNTKVNNVDGKVTVNFPMKAYLEYDVVFYSNNFSFDSDGPTRMKRDTVRAIHANNTIGHFAYDAPENNYNVKIVARSLNEKYAANDGTKLNISGTPYISASWSSSDSMLDKSVRVEITKLTNKDYEYISSDWYKVRRIDENDYDSSYDLTYKSFTDESTGYYYFYDEVPDVTHNYRYELVVTNGINRSENTYTLAGKTPGNLEEDISVVGWSGYNSDMVWVAYLYNDATYASLNAYYLVVEGESYSEVTADEIKNKGTSCYISDSYPYYNSSGKNITFPFPSVSEQVTVYVLVEADLYPYESVRIVESAPYSAN